MREKTKFICPEVNCGGEVEKEATEGNHSSSTKHYYLICKKCGWKSPVPWSEAAIEHTEGVIPPCRIGDKK